MALDFLKPSFLNRLDARMRVGVLIAAIVGFVIIVYFIARYFSGDDSTVGQSRVANAPQNLASVPGSQLTPEYYRALAAANKQAAQQAQITGGSAVPTLLNQGDQSANASQCNIICSDQSANVSNKLDEWVKQGKITPAVATLLEQMANQNVPVSEFADQLDRLVKEGKLTPEQARELLEQYKKQHANALLQESAKTMDSLIKSGQLPLEAANELLTAQKNNVTPEEYEAILNRLVKEGKISPAVAKQLLAQYNKQKADEAAKENIALLDQMAKNGEITPEMAKQLADLTRSGASVDEYAAALQKAVREGKLTPAAAEKLLNAYKQLKLGAGPSSAADQMVKTAEAKMNQGIDNVATSDIDQLVKSGKLPPADAQKLKDLIARNASVDEYAAQVNQLVKEGKLSPQEAQRLIDRYQASQALKAMANRGVSPDEYAAKVNQLVREGKLSPEEAKQLIDDYNRTAAMRDEAKRLAQLQGNNASPEAYADELKRAVKAGILTPEQASQLMQQYQDLIAAKNVVPPTAPGAGGSDELSRLQQRLEQNGAIVNPSGGTSTAGGEVNTSDFAAQQAQAAAEAQQEREARVANWMTAMSSQAQQLITSWQPPTMAHKSGVPATDATSRLASANGASGTGENGSKDANSATAAAAPSVIKAGEVIFAVLDTGVNSDYPDSPVMATVVSGKFKGAKLLGKLVNTKGVSGQMDRVSLNFTLMNDDRWTQSKSVTAYAVDPDTARTVLASNVDYHYMMRFGAIMATSFLQGYANALQTSGATATTGIFGTSSVNPELSPAQKVAVGLGQIGQSLGTVTQNYVNIPPTVKVDSGVGLGILFMADVTG